MDEIRELIEKLNDACSRERLAHVTIVANDRYAFVEYNVPYFIHEQILDALNDTVRKIKAESAH